MAKRKHQKKTPTTKGSGGRLGGNIHTSAKESPHGSKKRIYYQGPSGKFVSKASWVAYRREAAKRLAAEQAQIAQIAAQLEAEQQKALRKALRADEALESKRREAALRGWETRRQKAVQVRRSAAAKLGWAHRKATAKARAQRSRLAKLRAAKALRGKGGRFATPRKAAAYEREKLKAEKATEVERKKREKQAAGLKGWHTVQQKACEARIKAGPGPSDALRAEFTDPRWLSGTWYNYPDGQQEGQILIGAGPANQLNRRLIYLSDALQDKIRNEPVWVQAGFKHSKLDPDKYDKFEGVSYSALYSRKAKFIGDIFHDQRRLAESLLGSGAKIEQVVVRVYFGDRPERAGK